MKYFTTSLTAILGIILLTPFTTHASITGHGYAIGDEQALYMIEFSFVTSANDYYIPIQARNHPESLEHTVTYDITDDTTSTPAATASIVLSDLEVVDDHYRIPAGETGSFTLVIFADITDPNHLSSYRAQVNSLPHLIGEDKTSTDVSDTAIEFLTTPGVQFPLVLGGGK